jgi:hypothetical protein
MSTPHTTVHVLLLTRCARRIELFNSRKSNAISTENTSPITKLHDKQIQLLVRKNGFPTGEKVIKVTFQFFLRFQFWRNLFYHNCKVFLRCDVGI